MIHTTGVEVEASFGFPDGRTFSSYFENVHGGALALLVLALILMAIVYKVFVDHDGNMSQAVGWIVIVLLLVFMAAPGLVASREVVIDFGRAIKAWLITK